MPSEANQEESLSFEGFFTPAAVALQETQSNDSLDGQSWSPGNDTKTSAVMEGVDRLQYKHQAAPGDSGDVAELGQCRGMEKELSQPQVGSAVATPDDDGEAPLVQAVQVSQNELNAERVEDLEIQLRKTQENTKKRLRLIWSFFGALIAVSALVVGGVCGTGNCSARVISSSTTRADSPSLAPTPFVVDPVRARDIAGIINSASTSNVAYPISEENPSFEAMALTWLIESDKTQRNFTIDPQNYQRWFQRFVISSLLIRSRELAIEADLHECSWSGVTCGADNTTIVELRFSDENFLGTIPEDIGLLSSLAGLWIVRSSLTGWFPSSLLSLSKLRELVFWDNRLAGTIPPRLGQITTLEGILLQDNFLLGAIPVELSNLPKLSVLDLSNNRLSSEVPSQLGVLSNLQYLHLHQNALFGTVAPELGELTALKSLILSSK